MSKVHKYQIFCETEGFFVESDEWLTEPISTCPHNVAHTVKEDSVEIAASKERQSVFFPGDYNGNYGNFRVRSVSRSGSFRFTFAIPHDFGTMVSLDLVGIVMNGAAGASKNIDFVSEYAHADEPYNQNSESDTTSTYDLTGKADQFAEINIAPVFTSLEAGHYCAILADHNNIGGYIRYIGIRMIYDMGEGF